MKPFENEPCICKHMAINHSNFVNECWYAVQSGCNCRKFKLDNLSLIENIAKERGLV
jgi:hypothetical protein